MGQKQKGQISDLQFAAFCLLLVPAIAVIAVLYIIRQAYRAMTHVDQAD